MDISHVLCPVNRQHESLVNQCMAALVNTFKLHDAEKFKTLPKSLNNTLLKKLSKRNYLNDNNIHVFLSEHTKQLELSECDAITDRSLEKISICVNLVKLDLNSNSTERKLLTSKGVSDLVTKCKNLQILLLRRCINIDNSCIDTISRSCTRLSSLNLGNCNLITDEALVSLGKNCKYLKSINLTGTKITDNGIFALFSNESLSKIIEEVHIAHCDLITDESIECILLSSKNIKYLLFHCCPKITDASRIALEDYMTNNSNQKVKHLTWSIY